MERGFHISQGYLMAVPVPLQDQGRSGGAKHSLQGNPLLAFYLPILAFHISG